MSNSKRHFDGTTQSTPHQARTSGARNDQRLRQGALSSARVALIVDDDPESTRLLTHCLAKSFDPLFACDVRQAHTCIESTHAIHLAFVAHDLPDGVGTQVLERLAERHPGCARVLTSRWDRGALPLGPLDLAHIFLSKPLHTPLVEAIQRVAIGPGHLNK